MITKAKLKKAFEFFLLTPIGNYLFFLIINRNYSSLPQNPKYVRIETTNVCNARCVFCPHKKMTRKQGFMEEDLFRKIIGDTLKMGINTIHLQNFGEPLLDKHIYERIKYAKKKGIKQVELFTNASLLNENNAKELINSGLDKLYISFEGYNKDIYNKLRDGLNYDVVSKKKKKIYSFKKTKPKIVLNVVYDKKYDKYVKQFKKEWKKYSDVIVLQQLHNWAGQENTLRFKNRKNSFCYVPWEYITINWDGSVVFCCLDYDKGGVVGDASNDSLEDIWKNQNYRLLRKKILSGSLRDIPLCKKCSFPLETPFHRYNCLNFLMENKKIIKS